MQATPPPTMAPPIGAARRERPLTATPRPKDGVAMAEEGEEREDRQCEAVADHDAWIIGQHGDEMRRPDPAAGRRARRRDPDPAGACLRGDRTMQQAGRGEARQEADQARKRDEAQLVFSRQAGENAEHRHGPLRKPKKATTPGVSLELPRRADNMSKPAPDSDLPSAIASRMAGYQCHLNDPIKACESRCCTKCCMGTSA